MGLDNGIRLKSKESIEFPDYVSVAGDELGENDKGFNYVYEICYWRKCWNIRSAIFEIICKNDKNGTEWLFDIEADNCKKIAEFLIEYLENPERWDAESTIWTFDEYKGHLLEDIVNLFWLSKFLKENTKCYAEFYDSY